MRVDGTIWGALIDCSTEQLSIPLISPVHLIGANAVATICQHDIFIADRVSIFQNLGCIPPDSADKECIEHFRNAFYLQECSVCLVNSTARSNAFAPLGSLGSAPRWLQPPFTTPLGVADCAAGVGAFTEAAEHMKLKGVICLQLRPCLFSSLQY